MRDLESFDNSSGRRGKGQVEVKMIKCKMAMTPSNLPGLDYALNPYHGCSHACTYCYAPYVLHLSRDEWSGAVGVKVNIPRAIALEVEKKKGVIGVGTVTDPYQSIEDRFSLTRKCLKELLKADRSVSILTKSPLVTRDIDLISGFSSAEVGLTVTTQHDDLAVQFEPSAPPPSQRLDAAEKLVDAGIDTYILIGPSLPGIIDSDLDDFLSKIASTGVKRVMLDKLRIRPGMMELFRALPMMREERRWSEFNNNALSDSYYYELSKQMYDLCSSHGMKCSQAF